MKRAAALSLIVALSASPAQADTLREALARAYRENPTITASRAQLRAVDENVPLAKAAGRPTLSTNGGVTENYLRSGNSFTTPEKLAQAQLALVLSGWRFQTAR